jgi:hypothetical protein
LASIGDTANLSDELMQCVIADFIENEFLEIPFKTPPRKAVFFCRFAALKIIPLFGDLHASIYYRRKLENEQNRE